ncbi:hypothetical protein SAMN05661044_00188 [Olivibacter domesticus]|uniref:Uncharacterized protein n=1 Tax=Olivibacter domesticus TaxID=407022 RepID=A0A1H7GTY7_OLID1|nr:hypothetical protein SAMN05661044_00188 [Olivibacter domesticus]
MRTGESLGEGGKPKQTGTKSSIQLPLWIKWQLKIIVSPLRPDSIDGNL